LLEILRIGIVRSIAGEFSSTEVAQARGALEEGRAAVVSFLLPEGMKRIPIVEPLPYKQI
jgi:hypothetical protein